MESLTSIYGADHRYHSLRIISAIFTLIGAALLLIGILLLAYSISALLTYETSTPPPGPEPFGAHQRSVASFVANLGPMFTLYAAFVFLVSGFQSVAFGALIRLAIQLEENTRASAQFLDKIRRRLESGGEAVEPIFRS